MRPDGVEPFSSFPEKHRNSGSKFPVPQSPEGKERNQESADKESDPVQSIGNCTGSQSPENSIRSSDQSHHDHNKKQLVCFIVRPQHGAQIQNVDHSPGTGVENNGKQDHHIGKKKDQIAKHPGRFIEPVPQVFRNGSDPRFQELGQEPESHQYKSHHSHHFPCHDTHPLFECGSIQSHHLFRGKIGQEQ